MLSNIVEKNNNNNHNNEEELFEKVKTQTNYSHVVLTLFHISALIFLSLINCKYIYLKYLLCYDAACKLKRFS